MRLHGYVRMPRGCGVLVVLAGSIVLSNGCGGGSGSSSDVRTQPELPAVGLADAASLRNARYRVVPLGTSGAANTVSTAKPTPVVQRVDDSALFVAGINGGTAGTSYAFRVERGAVAASATVTGAPTPNQVQYAYVSAINRSGKMSGFATATGLTTLRPFIASFGGDPAPIPDPQPLAPSVNARSAYGLSDEGIVVGEWERRAFYSEGGGIRFLQMPRQPASDVDSPTVAFDINSGGMIVGYATLISAQRERAVLWPSKDSAAVQLPLLPNADVNPFSRGYAINSAGWIVGYAATAASSSSPLVTHAALWTSPTTVEDLGSLGGSGEAAYERNSIAYAINDAGLVVGTGNCKASTSTRCGFAWSRADGMIDLNTLLQAAPVNVGAGAGAGAGAGGVWHIEAATGVSNSGVIAAQATLDGVPQDVLLVPEAYADQDGDGIPDSWERDGIPVASGARSTSLFTAGLVGTKKDPDRGPEVGVRDVFVWYDWVGDKREPPQSALNEIRAAFEASQTTPRLRIHFRRGGAVPVADTVLEDVNDQRDLIEQAKQRHFYPAANGNRGIDALFRYALFIGKIKAVDDTYLATGVAPTFGKDVLLAVDRMRENASATAISADLSRADAEQLLYDTIGITTMHELGHTLGLGHGGVTMDDGNVPVIDNRGYKPNHLSVMNYAYSGELGWLRRDGNPKRIYDFSQFSSPPFLAIEESQLDESVGLGTTDLGWTRYQIHWCTSGSADPSQRRKAVREPSEVGTEINWNQDKSTDLNAAVQFDCAGGSRPGPLTTIREWDHLTVRRAGIGALVGVTP